MRLVCAPLIGIFVSKNVPRAPLDVFRGSVEFLPGPMSDLLVPITQISFVPNWFPAKADKPAVEKLTFAQPSAFYNFILLSARK
jgi:hypothetical protein